MNNSDATSNRIDWFTRLVGFSERTPEGVRNQLTVEGEKLSSKVNGKYYQCGSLEIVSLDSLRQRVSERNFRPSHESSGPAALRISEIVGDAKKLHADLENAGALFQVASQFNLLEMVAPSVTPEAGVGIYENDPTQGPACAIACGAGTIYRNYFAVVNGQIGQSRVNQIDCLEDIGEKLGNEDQRLWNMKNGYALPSEKGLREIADCLKQFDEQQREQVKSKLKIGVHWNTQVTIADCQHTVTQAYCSALPVAYSNLPSSLWEPFARLVLDAAYEATLATALLNAEKTTNKTVFLTLLGGGAFGNQLNWILDAIRQACHRFQHCDLDVKIVSYAHSRPEVRQMISAINQDHRSS